MVMAQGWIKVPPELSDSILTKQPTYAFIRDHVGEGLARGLEYTLAARVLAAIDLESTRIKEIKNQLYVYYFLFEEKGEDKQLGNAKFVAHLINIGMTQQEETSTNRWQRK